MSTSPGSDEWSWTIWLNLTSRNFSRTFHWKVLQNCCTWLCIENNKEVHWGLQCCSYSMRKVGMSVSFPWPMLTRSLFFSLWWLGHSRAQLSSSVFVLLYFHDKSRNNILHWKSYLNNTTVGNIDSDNIESSKVIVIRKELSNLLSLVIVS